jgi:hypothetical protein
MKSTLRCAVVLVVCTGLRVYAQVGGSGTPKYIPIWTETTKLGDSALYQSVQSSGVPSVGINTTSGEGCVTKEFPVQDCALEIDSGNMVVKGSNNFQGSGDTAFVYVGDRNHPIEAIWGVGLSIATYRQVSSVFVADKTGFVGIQTTSPRSALEVNGDVKIDGILTKGAGSFKIDDPIDPGNKYLYHSFVESPDMMNIYNGNVSTDKQGFATVRLPKYFSALNRDFRYQLTVVGQFAQAIIAHKIEDNQFVIRTNKPNVEVSWQVTGIRQDAYANAHRIPVEEDKPPQEQGHYLYPEFSRVK